MAQEVRKTVTVVFCDVVASTELGEQLDPEALRHVMSRYFSEMSTALERHGGTIEKFIGDEVMAVFGVPVVHEDDALRAVRAGAEMRDRLQVLNEELEVVWGTTLKARIGINTGEVLAGDPSRGHGFVTGDAVVTAKRLEQAAGPGEILLGPATHELVKHTVTASRPRPLPLKGKREPVPSRRLEGIRPDTPAFETRLDAPLVGRAEELAELQRVYERTAQARSLQLVTVFGPAGIGKSRLVRELVDSVRDEATVLVGRCLRYGEGITFWPVREIFPDETLEGTSEEIFWRVRKRLEQLGREQPVVVCFEDIHWAEPSLLDLVQYLAGWIADAPVLVVCLARPELLETRPEWLTPDAKATVISLHPLPDDETQTLLGQLDTPHELRRRITEAAEGNPLFVEQMAAMAAEDGATLPVPPSIRALLAERLDRLSVEQRAVIERAAVVGRAFPLGAIAAIAADDLRPDVGGHLLALVRKGLIAPDPGAFTDEDGFRFRHALIRDAAYGGLPKVLRAELHERHAAWLEGNGGEPAIIGYHLEQAFGARAELAPVDDRGRALGARASEHLAAAGRRALRSGDASDAASLLRRAAALVEHDRDRHARLLPDLGSALIGTGALADATSSLTEAVEYARAASDPLLEAHALTELTFVRAYAESQTADFGEVAASVLPVFEEHGDHVGLARGLSLIGLKHFSRSRYAEMADVLRLATEHARLAGDVREEYRVFPNLTLALTLGPTPADEAIDLCSELYARAEGDYLVRARVASGLAWLRAMRGDFAEARQLYGDSKAMLVELGSPFYAAAVALFAGPVEMLAGDPDAAERELRWGYDMLAQVGERSALSTAAGFLAQAVLAQGRVDEAERLAAESEGLAASEDLLEQLVARRVRATCAAVEGDHRAAARLALEAVRLSERSDSPILQADALFDLAQIRRRAGASERAAQPLRRALDLYTAKGNVVASAAVGSLLENVGALDRPHGKV